MRHLSALRAVTAAVLILATAPSLAHATWSVVALNRATGRMVVSSATCVSQTALRGFPSSGLMDVQAIIAPGFGVAAAQAGVDRTRANQSLIHGELRKGTHPSEILAQLMTDPGIQTRQFGIIDLQGRAAGFSGARNLAASLSVYGLDGDSGGPVHTPLTSGYTGSPWPSGIYHSFNSGSPQLFWFSSVGSILYALNGEYRI